jgi:hypothetical protein
MREYGLPFASRPRVAADPPMQLPDLRAAEFSEPSNDAVKLND